MRKRSHKVLALIPARGGSTGIPGKNIKAFCGKPLIAYTIRAAQQAGIFDKIVVSTDSPKIASVSRAFGADMPYLRPKKLATSRSDVVDTVIHMLNRLRETEDYEPDFLFLLQPTSPLRDAGDIRASFTAFKKSGAPALVSVCKTHHQILHIEHGRVQVINRDMNHVNRQELPQTYKQDGSMIYVVDVAYFMRHKTFMPEGETAAYVVPKWKAVDIDDAEDFKLAEALYKNRRAFGRV